MKTVTTHIRSIAALSRVAAVAVALTVGMAACTNDDFVTDEPEGRVPITIADAAITRATDAAWDAGDQIALSLHHPESGANVGDCKGYTYVTTAGDGNFAPIDADNTAYYPANGSAVRIQAMYPMNSPAMHEVSGREGVIAIDLSDQSTPAAIDLMSARAATDNSAKEPAVSLAFRHRLVRVNIRINTADVATIAGIAGAEVTIKQIACRVTFDANTQELTGSDTPGDITRSTGAAGSNGLFATSFILAPAASISGTVIAIDLKDEAGTTLATYNAICGNLALDAGTDNTLTVSLRRTGAEISGVSITPWTEGISNDLPATIDGISSADEAATGTFAPTEGNLLIVLNEAGTTTEAARATYVYQAASGDTPAGWRSDAPLCWDWLEQGATYDAILRYSPAAPDAATGETDVLKSVLSGLPFGSALNATGDNALQHALSKLTVKLKNNLTDAAGAAIAVSDIRLHGLYQSLMAATAGEVKSGELSDLLYGNSTGTEGGNTAATGIAYSVSGTTATAGEGHIINPQAVGGGVEIVITAGGNSYTYPLKSGLTALLAGTHHQLTLTLSESGIALGGINVADWTPKTTTGGVTIDGIGSSGDSGNLTPATGDQLMVRLTATGTDVTGSYTYGSSGWTTTSGSSVLTWDALAQGTTYTAEATYLPAASDGLTGEKDLLQGSAFIAFGTPLNFTGSNALSHAMSKLTIKVSSDLAGGTAGISAITLSGLYKSTYLTAGTPAASAGNTSYGTLAYTVATATGSSGETHLFCPQTVGSSAQLVITAGGNSYTYPLKSGLTALLAGTHHQLTLTLGASGITLDGISVADWTPTTTAGDVTIDGIGSSGGIGNLTPATDDQLMVRLTATGTDVTGSYTYGSSGWTTTSGSSVLTWDALSQGTTYTAEATYLPAASDGLTGEKDLLQGSASIAFGTPLNFTGSQALSHAMSKLTIKVSSDLAGGTADISAIALSGLYKSTYLTAGTPAATAGNTSYGTLAYTVATATGSSGETHLFCPQTVDSSAQLVITAGGNSYTYPLQSGIAALEGGHSYTLNLTLTPTGVEAGGISVEGWTDVEVNGSVGID